jgi:hydrogenase maturation factor
MAVEPGFAERLLEDLHEHGVAAAKQIGEFTDRVGRIEVV